MRSSGFLFAVFLLSIAAVSFAQTNISVAPPATPAKTVAMVYHKLTGKPPNFKKWALMTKDYLDASKFDKMMVRDKKAAEAQSEYSLLSLNEPVVIRTPVYISKYSFANKGFLIESFREDTYFSYEYGGDSYGIVIPDLIEYQWIAAEQDLAKKIDEAAESSSRRLLPAVIYFEPKFADASAPMQMDGKSYWLLSGRIRNIIIYTADEKTVLWEKQSKVYTDKKQRELMNLYQ
jgi:hypothetical protein